MSHLSKTAALKTASAHVGGIYRRSSTDYVYYAPYYAEKLDGPSTECQSGSWPQAVLSRSRHVVEIALVLMGYSDQDASDAAYMASRDGGTAAQILAAALAGLTASGTHVSAD